MIDITASQHIFSVTGITLLVLGLSSCVIVRRFRVGVFAILLADICFAVAIAFPKKAAECMSDFGATEEYLASEPLVMPVIAGIVLYLVLYGTGFILKKYVMPEAKAQEAEKSGQSGASSSVKTSDDKSPSSGDSTCGDNTSCDNQAETENVKAQTGEDNGVMSHADPRIFEKLRAK